MSSRIPQCGIDHQCVRYSGLSITGNPLWFPQAQLQTNATESSEAELALHTEVRGLRSELDEAKRKASRLSQEHRELSLRLEDTEKDKETLKQTISQLEETERQQGRALEKLNKEVRRRNPFYTFANKWKLLQLGESNCSLQDSQHEKKIHPLCLSPSPSRSPCQYESLTVSSREEAQALRVQLEEQRERARKEMQEVHRHGNDAQSELERTHTNLRRLEEEVCVFVLSVCVGAHDYSLAWPGCCFYYKNDVWSECFQ